MAKKESVLTRSEKASFEIEYFIFHIINHDQKTPTYLENVTLNDPQKEFFKDRFSDVSEGIQHLFLDKENSVFFKSCKTMLEDPGKNFLSESKSLASSFQNIHFGNTLPGAFIIAIVKINSDRRLIFILKIDHKKVFGYQIKDAKAILNEVTNAFVEDNNAIQKSALIDVTDHYSWDVLAKDRSGSAEKPLTDFFSNFLNVTEKESPSTLTKQVVKTIKDWAVSNRLLKGLQQDVASYKQKGIEYLKGTALFNAEDCINSIFRDEVVDENRRKELTDDLKNYFDQVGLSGQQFIPSRSSITASVRKNVRQTAEGVKIEWEGNMTDNNITIPTERNEDGYYHITIKTNSIEIKN